MMRNVVVVVGGGRVLVLFLLLFSWSPLASSCC